MITCPKCGNVLSDDAKFCNNCGSRLEEIAMETPETEAPAAETPVTAAPATETPVEETSAAEPAAFSQPAEPVGYNPIPDPYATDPNAKKNSKKIILIGGIAVAAVAVVAVAIALIAGAGKKDSKSNVALYIRDDQLVYNNLKGDPIELSDDLYDDYDFNADTVSYYAANTTYVSGKSNLVIYPDKMEYTYSDDDYSSSYGYTLYYVKGVKEEMEPEKLANDVKGYLVSEDEKTILYMTSDGNLYTSDFKEKEKIDSDVTIFYATDDCSKVVYKNSDDNLYLWQNGEEEKLDSDVSHIEHVSEDLSKIFYMQEDRLYVYDTKEGAETKIASDVDDVLEVYDSGEVYYLVAEEKPISDLIDDDMAASDAELKNPDDLVNEAYDLEYPDYDDYEDYDDYWDAYDAYWEEYEALDDAYWDEYYELSDAYGDKDDRDYLRECFEEDTYTTYSLYYFDGKDDVLVSESYDCDYSVSAEDKAVIAFTATASEIEKVKISELDYYSYYASTVAEMAMSGSQTLQVAVKDTATEVEVQEEGFQIEAISDDGKTLLILDNAEYEMDEDYEEYEGTEYEDYYKTFECGELFRITIGDTPGAPESVATDVYSANFAPTGKIAYMTDYDRETYTSTMFYDGVELGEIYTYSNVYHKDTDSLLFFTDWDEDDECGKLMMFRDGKITEIKDEVHSAVFTAKGDILYLYDYSTSREKGDLYKYTGKDEDLKLDEDVQAIVDTSYISNADRS